MLVLLSFALVLVATVLLVLGLLNDDGLTLIYLSIASSVAAAVVLLVALRLNKPKAEHRAAAPSPLPDRVEPVAAGADEPAEEKSEWLASEQESWPAEDVEEEGEEVEFPIADYDSLTVGQILPLLPQLYPDEVGVVEERERLTKARPQVLAKLAELSEGAEVTTTTAAAAPAEAVAASSPADPLASYTEAPAPAWDDDDDWFPIEDYESLSAAQIRPLLPELDDEELELVRTREMSLGRRRSLLDEIDRRLGTATEPEVPAASSAPAPRATTRSTPARTTTKKASPAKRTTATKATTKRSAPAKKTTAAAKKTTTKKAAPAKRATPAKKSAAKKAAPAKKATPAKKTTTAAKKATTTKKATATKKATKKR